jgi:sugar phosphate isomerase/epimerase
LPDRIDGAAHAGYDAVTVSPADYREATESGIDPSVWVRRAADKGVALTVLDAVIEWYPHAPPKRPLGGSNITVDEVMRGAAAFGVEIVGALAPFPTDMPVEELGGYFAALCDRAANDGLRVQFEFTPKSPVDDVAKSAALIEAADRPNAGILVDSWHFYRVNPDFEALAAVPDGKIFSVQISDGAAEFVEGLLADTFRHRLLPGDGVFDLGRLIRALDAKGALNLVGPEVLSLEQFALPVAEGAKRAGDALDRALAAALNATS